MRKRCVLPRKLFDRFSVLHIITQLLFAIFFVLSGWDGDYIVVVNCIIIMYHGLWIFVYFVYFVVLEIACIRVHSLFRGMPRKRRRRGCSWSEGGATEPRKDTNGHECHPPVDRIRCLSACVRAMDFRVFRVFRGSGIQLPPSAPSLYKAAQSSRCHSPYQSCVASRSRSAATTSRTSCVRSFGIIRTASSSTTTTMSLSPTVATAIFFCPGEL